MQRDEESGGRGGEGKEHGDLGGQCRTVGGRPTGEVSQWSEWVLAGDLINQRNGLGAICEDWTRNQGR